MEKREDINIDNEIRRLDRMGVEPYLIEWLRQQKIKEEISQKYN